jgi:hypothetical protein
MGGEGSLKVRSSAIGILALLPVRLALTFRLTECRETDIVGITEPGLVDQRANSDVMVE